MTAKSTTPTPRKGRALPKVAGAEKLPGRVRKDIAMASARAIAARGGYESFRHVLEAYERENPDDASLRLWASASDKT
jgi:hypothetical protein